MNIAIVLASGKGTRMGLDEPKQFININGKPLYIYTLENISSSSMIDCICLVANEEYFSKIQKDITSYSLSKVLYLVKGGITRQESVFNALKMLKQKNISFDDIVLIHDAARVLVNQEIINMNIDACLKYGAVDTIIPCSDTVIQSLDKKRINSIPLRSELFNSQTPQTFKFGLIYNAHLSSLGKNATDDCRLVLESGHDVFLIEGSKLNFKVTTIEDLKILQALLTE